MSAAGYESQMQTVIIPNDVNIGEEVTLDFILMRDDPVHWYNHMLNNFMIFIRVEKNLIQFL